MIFAMTIQGFEDCGRVDEVVVVANENEIYCSRILLRNLIYKVKALAPGGETRQQSVFATIPRVPDCGIVLIHDVTDLYFAGE